MHCYMSQPGMLCTLGNNTPQIAEEVFNCTAAPLTRSDQYSAGKPKYLGQVLQQLPKVPTGLTDFDCRNNRMLIQVAEQIGPDIQMVTNKFSSHRIGVVLGTSTSGIDQGEISARRFWETGRHLEGFHFRKQQLSGGSDFLASYLGITGPTLTVSTACSSSANAIGVARRWLLLGRCDAVIVGGADTLCKLTVQGFDALEALSNGIANPSSLNRDGINIGEGCALTVLTREPLTTTDPIEVLGVGSTSDAHHISAPDPSGSGAIKAMEYALQQSGINGKEIDYVNLHGTGTRLNDIMESQALSRIIDSETPVSSTKPMTGHVLGSAGILETALCWLTLDSTLNPSKLVIPHLWDQVIDPELAPLHLAEAGNRFTTKPLYCLSNSFAFGGNNCSIVLGVST